ncbi:MAG: hypothetical protein LBT44_07095 [Clostridiales bacterium]|jgi:hypothetical protein|nr:hypothetical protein [Clostridiales bacterium]
MTDTQSSSIRALHAALERHKNFHLSMIVGVDGFIDEIIHVVDQRQDFDHFTRVSQIEDLGGRIIKASGLSANFELVVQQTKLGGNGPIFSNALIEYGVRLTYIGAIGQAGVHPVFQPMAEKAAMVYPLCEPGHTDALEFNDGKLMLGKITRLNAITWRRFKEVLGAPPKMASLLGDCRLMGMENWTMIPHMSEIWRGFIEEVFPFMPDAEAKPLAFFDLADPEKRTKEDILEALQLIGLFQKKFEAILGLNEKELYEIAAVLDIESSDLRSAAQAVYDKLGIYCLAVHPVKEAVCCLRGQYFQADGPYCARPVLTTGAGDNFNAGFCLAQALGFSPMNSLLLGVSTSGYYVRHGKSPDIAHMLIFLQNWLAGGV